MKKSLLTLAVLALVVALTNLDSTAATKKKRTVDDDSNQTVKAGKVAKPTRDKLVSISCKNDVQTLISHINHILYLYLKGHSLL